jgi:four helix bundle protein
MDKLHAVEDLEVFKKAYRISLDVHRHSLNFPPIEQYALGDQVRRASKAICANLAKGLVARRRRRRSSSASS